MEKLSDAPLFVDKTNTLENHIINNEEDMQEVSNDDLLGEEPKEIVGDESSLSDNKCSNNDLNEDNLKISSNEICNGDLTDKDIHRIEDKIVNLENEHDSGVFEDILRQESELLKEDSNSLKEQNEFVSKEHIPPISDTDDINDSAEKELAINKGVLDSDDSDDELPLLDNVGVPSDLAISEPPFPVEDEDESDVEQENRGRAEIRSTRRDLSLPYFQLPKPDLDEFLIETEKNLEIPIKPFENKISEHSSVPKPKPKNIVTLKPPPDVKGNIFDPKKVFITFDLSIDVAPSKISNTSENNPKVSSGPVNNEYEKVLSNLDTDEKTPGVKRLALKEFLKKQIDQKKYEAFNQSKIFNKMNEEMEEELFEKDEGPVTDDEDSDYEEATVSFDKKEQNSGDENSVDEAPEELQLNDESNDENALDEAPDELQLNDESNNENALGEAPDELQLNYESNDEESDDDFIGVRKTKKKFLVLDDDDDDSCDNEDFKTDKKNNCNLSDIENSSTSQSDLPEILETKFDEQPDHQLILNNSEINNRDLEHSKSRESAFEIEVDKTPKRNSIFSQISSSLPSFQPGGGFLNQDPGQEDSLDSISSTSSQQNMPNVSEANETLGIHLQPEQSILRAFKTPNLESDSPIENAPSPLSDDNNNLGIKLDDLPVSQSVNDSNIFLTEELADVCSGAFNKEDSPERNLKYSFAEKMNDFFDDEAELSGEDDGVDERDDSENEGDCLDILASDEENLPESEVLREEIADLHMKRLKDEDEERIKAIQEHFLDDGELDGTGRSRRFAWINNDGDVAPIACNSDSDSDAEAIDDSLALNPEKAKWLQENKEDENKDITEELNSSGYKRKSLLKVDIIGKLKFSQEDSRRLSFKRPRGSYLNLDDSSASQVLKKLKTSEDNLGGSRTTKHFVFRNDSPEVSVRSKEIPLKSATLDLSKGNGSPMLKSVFSKI